MKLSSLFVIRNHQHKILLFLLSILYLKSTAQDNKNLLLTLFKEQKEYINSAIKEKERCKYLSYQQYAHILHPKIWQEILNIHPSFSVEPDFNILEYFPGANTIEGIIWLDSTYYAYSYGPNKKLLVKQQSFSQLNLSWQAILLNFNNWNHVIFTSKGTALNSPYEHPFYLATRIRDADSQTIAFTLITFIISKAVSYRDLPSYYQSEK